MNKLIRPTREETQQAHIVLIVFLLSLLLSSFIACSSDTIHKKAKDITVNDTIIAPVVIKSGKPIIHHLNSYSPPEIINLSNYLPPIKRTAGFFVNMPNFNTEQGLALSSILCGFKDTEGNLWFGTSGNGVSKYNGKSFTNYNSSHGLIHNLINCITEDKKGNIWFGTYGGVSKYDGISFENFTTEQGLPNNDVIQILEDAKGNIWMSSSNGITKLKFDNNERSKNMFFNYTKEHGVPNNQAGDLFEDTFGNLWVVTANGIFKYNPDVEAKNGKPFVNYTQSLGLEGKIIQNINNDKNGNIWLITNEGVFKYKPGEIESGKKVFAKLSKADGLVSDFVLCSTVDKEGNIWFGTREGITEYRVKDSSFVKFSTKQGLANNAVYSITEDNSGSLWFGTLGGGLSRYDGESITGYRTEQGLLGNVVYASAIDNIGNLWFGSEDFGITKYEKENIGKKEKSFINYTTAQGLQDNYILTMIFDRAGNLWHSDGYYGLHKYDGKSIITYKTDQGLVNNIVECLYEDTRGNIWIGTYEGGISLFDGTSFKNYTTEQGLVHNTIWDFHEDKNNNIWIATRGGLSIFNGSSFINFTKEQGLPDNKLSIVTEDKAGNIIIGSWGGGVSIIRKSIAEKLAQSLTLHSGAAIFENFTTDNGLANNVVYGILEDHEGNIFIGTNLGFTVLKGGIDTTNLKIAKEGIEIYNEKTGYSVKDISNNCSMVIDKQDVIWAGTGDKLVRFDYKSVKKTKAPPKVFIQNISINNEKISWYNLQWAKMKKNAIQETPIHASARIMEELNVFGRKLRTSERDTMLGKFKGIDFESIRKFNTIPEKLVLPYAYNNISFDFVGVETARPFLVRYQYILKGYDKSWSPVTDKTTASFGNISGGNYTFMLRAQSPDGVWSKPVSYSFEVLPPWYLSWPAYFFYSLLFLTGIIAVDRFQRRRVIFKERQRVIKRELEQARKIEKANKLLEIQKKVVEEKNSELNAQNEEITTQRDLLSRQNNSINEGILYAKRIQTAVFPRSAYIDEILPENFILFKPKDKVSGDFYWIKQIRNLIVIAAADCTGHGVPGAIMSMLGISFINEIVQKREITQANHILNDLRKQIKQALRQTGKKGETNDGMDMALCVLETRTNKIQYSGANNPLYLIRNNELTIFKADRMPIGYYPNEKPSFTNHEIQLKTGDIFYLFSDGFSDQFGGEKGFKYKASNFQKILLENYQKPMVIQKELLEQELTNWMQGYEQTDDILVMGVRVL